MSALYSELLFVLPLVTRDDGLLGAMAEIRARLQRGEITFARRVHPRRGPYQRARDGQGAIRWQRLREPPRPQLHLSILPDRTTAAEDTDAQ